MRLWFGGTIRCYQEITLEAVTAFCYFFTSRYIYNMFTKLQVCFREFFLVHWQL